MNRNKRTKMILIIGILVAEAVLTGAGIFSVGLRNVDERGNRLVKIDSLIGGSGMPNMSDIPNVEEEPDEPIDKQDDDPNVDNRDETSDEPNNASVTIRVRGTKVYINESLVSGGPFESRFPTVYDGKGDVIIMDDYADYRVYRSILDYLNKQGVKPKERQS
ncbi:MAG: hypothetical protein K5662_06100 [Lachnospiraceae bacterium]|nr:hypothetical protein [Lachnospiraceae bacterium]